MESSLNNMMFFFFGGGGGGGGRGVGWLAVEKVSPPELRCEVVASPPHLRK